MQSNLHWLILFLICYLAQGAFAQDQLEIERDFEVKYIGLEQGLSNNSVTSIYKDPLGFMWFGTYDGLNRFDGHEFNIFRNQPDDSTSLISNRIVSIHGQGDEVWVGTKSGLSVYDFATNRFSDRHFKNESSQKEKIISPINSIDHFNDKIFIATGGRGLLQRGQALFEQVPLRLANESKLNYHAQDITIDKNNTMWVFVQGYGLCKFEESVLVVETNVVLSAKCLDMGGEGEIWLGLDNGLMKYNYKNKEEFIYSTPIIRYEVTDILYSSQKQEVWAATDGNGVVILDKTQNTLRRLNEGIKNTRISSNSIYSLFRDDSGREWIGTLRGGVNILDYKNKMFKTILNKGQNEISSASDFILSFCEQPDGRVWIGTDGGGTILWDRETNNFKSYANNPDDPNSVSNNFVTRIANGKEGVWFATYGGGVNFFDKTLGQFRTYPLFNAQLGYEQKNVWVLYRDQDEEIWAATIEGDGLYKYNQEKDEFEFVDAGIQGLISLFEDADGQYWAGTFGQLIKLDLDNKDHRFFDIGYPVRDIEQIQEGSLLLGTEGKGLIMFNEEEGITEVFTQTEGLPNNSVLNILTDNNGDFWLSTYFGISRFNLEQRTFVNYFDTDGLQSNQFNYNAALKLSDGKLLMGGIKGLNVIDPNLESLDSAFPKLVISEIKINNEDLTDYQGLTAYAARELKLPSDRSMLTLNYAALEYNFPDRISYAYFLDGWDMKWQKVAESRVANYSKIPPGKYVFKLKSTNSDGKWNDHVIELPIEILPPWYKTIWAYIAYVLLGITFWAGILYYQRERERLKYNIELSRKMAQKDKELNEKKLTFFTNISHEFCSHLTLIINPLKDVIYRSNEEIGNVPVEVEVAYHNSRRLLSLADQLLLFRKTESETGEIRVSHIDMVELTQEVFSCFLHQAKSQNVNYVFHTEEKKCLIYGDKHKLEMALFNLISNSLKFTSPQGGQVQVSLVNDQKGVIIRVEDNGSGIPKRERNTVFDLFYQYDTNKKPSTRGFGIGLYLVKKFVTLHEGKIVCTESELGGAQFEICLLKGKKHFDKDVLIHKDYGEHSVLLDELMYDEAVENAYQLPSDPVVTELMDDSKLILVIDDNAQIRKYIRKLLSDTYRIQEANSAEDGFEMIKSVEPDLIISDVVMEGMSGVDLCKKIKMSEDYGYLPVILITASSAEEIKLKGTEVGADDYITKPFDNDYLKARVRNILKRQEVIQKHLLDEVTKKHENVKLSETDKQLLDKMSELIEDHMENEDFNVRLISEKIGMSHSLLYKRVKQLTGKSINEFVRHIRLRKVASLLLTSDVQVNEAAYRAGFSDLKYFRKQFNQLYGMNPSEFQKKYKNAMMDKQYVLNESFFKKQ